MMAHRTEVSIREATSNDVPSLARVHKRAYSADHFTSLLPRRMLKTYYRAFLGEGSTILVAELEEDKPGSGRKIVGFAVFGRNIGPRIAQFKKANRYGIVATAVRHPIRALRKSVNAARHLLGPDPVTAECDYLLLSIATDAPNKGVGSRLLEAMHKRAVLDQADRIGLYVHATNTRAINSYAASGYRIEHMTGGQYYMEKGVVSD